MWIEILTISQMPASSPAPSRFYGGCDLGMKEDHSVVAVVEKRGGEVFLVYLKRFALNSGYPGVIGWLNLLNKQLNVRRILIDQTGVGETFLQEVRGAGVKNAMGVMLSLPTKQEIMVYLRQAMENGRLHLPFDRELIGEMNVERFRLNKTGQNEFYHPSGTHDDRLWALALAVYTSRYEMPQFQTYATTGKRMPLWMAIKVKKYGRWPASLGAPFTVKRCSTCSEPIGPDGKCPKGHPG